MEINKNNLFARYYQWIYGELPNDVCSFFWGSLFAIGVFFLLVPGRLIIGKIDDDRPVVGQFFLGLISWLVYALAIALGSNIVGLFGYEFINLWGYLVFGAFIGAVVIGGSFFIGVGAVYVSIEKLPETTVAQNTKDWVGAIRKKHCVIIKWK